MKTFYIYILTSQSGTLVTGVTSNIEHRVYQHKHKLINGFTKKYNVDRLVYVEETTDIYAGLNREKEIKAWRRSKKVALTQSINPKWEDLAADWFDNECET